MLFKDEIPSLIYCTIYYFWKENKKKEAVDFFTCWVHDGRVVKINTKRMGLVAGMVADELEAAMNKQGYKLEKL